MRTPSLQAAVICLMAAGRISADEISPKALVDSGDLVVAPLIQDPLDDGRLLSLVRVELSPGGMEPRHTHPGPEILYGLAGTGTVMIDGKATAIRPGAVIRVAPGEAKAISNDSPEEPLLVLAILVLDRGQPPLKVLPDAAAK